VSNDLRQKDETNHYLDKIPKQKLGINLAIYWFVPLILVIVLRGTYGDTMALAIAGSIPVLKTIVMLVWSRRVDWIGVLSVLGFAAAFVISTLMGGSSLVLKLYHPIITGIIGLSLLGSVVIGRPLIIIVLQLMKRGDPERLSNPESRKRFTIITAGLGLVFLVDDIIYCNVHVHVTHNHIICNSKYSVWSKIVCSQLAVG
jgi:hypothetical protein